MSWTVDYHEAGGSIADAVAAMLQDATLTSVLTKLSDSATVAEPTVLRTVGYERVLRTGQWRNYAGAYLNRITGIDTEAPIPQGRDSSGRYLWKVTVYVTAARSIV